ncbi:Nn.00g062080.m01.CDS01 [Neocucurbitaria sp. VM-36]
MTFTVNALLLVSGILSSITNAIVLPPPVGWPIFTYQGVLTDNLTYNPTGEYISPTVFQAGLYLKNPLANWYLYYAPHDNPGGISLLYANNIEGPWTEYASNPVISNVWPGKYSVPHVSSPDAKWNTQAKKLFVYFHGTNAETRWAETTDGITFTYGGVAVTNAMGGVNVTETSYARVFTHRNPTSGYNYGMFYMGNEKDNKRRIRLAESVDGKVWTVDPAYVVSPGAEEQGNVSGGNLWEWDGQLYVIYHASSGKSYARTIDSTLRNVASTPILLHKASGVGNDVGRVASPEVVTKDGKTYLFYESGARLGASIAWAKAA